MTGTKQMMILITTDTIKAIKIIIIIWHKILPLSRNEPNDLWRRSGVVSTWYVIGRQLLRLPVLSIGEEELGTPN